MALSLWVSANALKQSRLAMPGEDAGQALRALLFGGPVLRRELCSEAVHAAYTVTGPDGQAYPTWHPPVDVRAGCYFDHEHGSDPHMYLGYPAAGLPAFGYPAVVAGLAETHAGYKVYVTNADEQGRAWLITLHQDTADPGRAAQQFHSLSWHISAADGSPLVHIRLLADFGYAAANCGSRDAIPEALVYYVAGQSGGQKRSLPTLECAGQNVYEAWDAWISVGEVFYAAPTFDVGNPASVIDPADLGRSVPMCAALPQDQSCASTIRHWNGSRRSVLHPGQVVQNTGPETFLTDAYGQRLPASSLSGIPQFVTSQGWNSQELAGPPAVYTIQTYSGGLYVLNGREPAGSAEFNSGLPFP